MVKHNKHKRILKIILILFCLGVVYLVAAWQFDLVPFRSQTGLQQQTLNTNERSSDSTAKQPAQKTPVNPDKTDNPKTPIQNEGEDPNDSPNLTGYFTTKHVAEGQLILRVTINQFLKSAGKCQLTLTHSSGKIVKRTSSTINNPSSSSCQGFNIPTSALESGRWQISLTIEADQKQGQIDGGELSL